MSWPASTIDIGVNVIGRANIGRPLSDSIVKRGIHDRQLHLMDMVEKSGKDFIRQIVAGDVTAGKDGARVQTRFPPEPNGYLHIGHAKAICLDFGVADEFGGECYLRFDDTNPEKEDVEYVEAIKEDVRWLGYDWGDRLAHASDYFPKLHDFAIDLI